MVDEVDMLSREELSALWLQAVNDLELEGGLQEGDRILRELLGSDVISPFSFSLFLKSIPEGEGYGGDGGCIDLPADVIGLSIADNVVSTDYSVEVRREGFDSPTVLARMPVSRFLLYACLAVVFHARFVDPKVDPWEVITRMTAACSRKNQLAKLSDRARQCLAGSMSGWASP